MASCAKIPYDRAVIPVFKQIHSSANVSQIYPIGGYGIDSYIGKMTDIVIHFKGDGVALQEIWTVSREGKLWKVLFKCKSSSNVCIKGSA